MNPSLFFFWTKILHLSFLPNILKIRSPLARDAEMTVGHFVDDYVELVRALEMRMERSQMAAYEGGGDGEAVRGKWLVPGYELQWKAPWTSWKSLR